MSDHLSLLSSFPAKEDNISARNRTLSDCTKSIAWTFVKQVAKVKEHVYVAYCEKLFTLLLYKKFYVDEYVYIYISFIKANKLATKYMLHVKRDECNIRVFR